MISAKFKGNFASTMSERISKWSSQKIAGSIVIPPELMWVIYQEYGVEPHPIQARNESLLALPGPVFKEIVMWSSRPKYAQGTHTIRKVQGTLPALLKEALAQAFAGNRDHPELAKAVFLEIAMPKVKAAITAEMAVDLPGHRAAEDPRFPRQAGKLEDRTAASVFDEKATIQESTE